MPVPDLDRAVRFYQHVLRQDGTSISPGRHYFGCGDVILAVYSPRADGDERDPRPNFDHVYFAVPDLDDTYRRAQEAGGLSTRIGDGNLPMGTIATRPWGERSFYMKDPAGNPLCFVDEQTTFTKGQLSSGQP
jgi:predicted enzyme related to lactoylglutathione lyase